MVRIDLNNGGERSLHVFAVKPDGKESAMLICFPREESLSLEWM
jgi:hypothetical protein